MSDYKELLQSFYQLILDTDYRVLIGVIVLISTYAI